jgi:hypothetical protein
MESSELPGWWLCDQSPEGGSAAHVEAAGLRNCELVKMRIEKRKAITRKAASFFLERKIKPI